MTVAAACKPTARLGVFPRDHPLLHSKHIVDSCTHASQAVYPSRNSSHAQPLAEVIRESAAIPPQQVITWSRVLVQHLIYNICHLLLCQRSETSVNGLPEVVLWMSFRLDTSNTWVLLSLREAEGPLHAIHLDACMKNTAKLQWRQAVC